MLADKAHENGVNIAEAELEAMWAKGGLRAFKDNSSHLNKRLRVKVPVCALILTLSFKKCRRRSPDNDCSAYSGPRLPL